MDNASLAPREQIDAALALAARGNIPIQVGFTGGAGTPITTQQGPPRPKSLFKEFESTHARRSGVNESNLYGATGLISRQRDGESSGSGTRILHSPARVCRYAKLE